MSSKTSAGFILLEDMTVGKKERMRALRLIREDRALSTSQVLNTNLKPKLDFQHFSIR